MPKQLSAEIAARNERLATLARQEKAALAALDRAKARLGEARARRESVVAQADEAVATAEAARDAALGAYALAAGAERAALTLGEDVRELRRLARESASSASANGEAAGNGDPGARPARSGRALSPPGGPRG